MGQQAQLSRRDAALYVFHNDGQTDRIQIAEQRVSVGRDPRNDVHLSDQSVRPRHATIYFSGGEHIISSVSDGTILLNGTSIGSSATLDNGDTIRIGRHEMRFVRMQEISATTLQLAICRLNEPHDVLLTRRPELRIGRQLGEVRIDDAFISDPHCVIENPYPGLLYLTNIDAVRGTKLNGARVTTRVALQDGDTLNLGTTTLRLNILAQASMPEPGQSIEAMRTGQPVPLRTPDAQDWDAVGITQELDESELRAADTLRRAERGDQKTYRSESKQPYYVPKDPNAKRATQRGIDDPSFHEGITSELPGVDETQGKKAQYYLPAEDE